MKTTTTFYEKSFPDLLAILKWGEFTFSMLFMKNRKGFCNTTVSLLVAFFSILCSSKTANANFTVPSGTIVRADTLTAYSGILTINGTLSLTKNTVLPGFTSVVINGPNGQIYWTNNSDLTFATGTTIVIKDSAAGLRPGGGNSSQRLWVGNTLIAVANNNSGPAALTFTDINIAGGIPQFTLAVSAVSICYGNTITATLMPLNTMLTYDCSWSVNNAGGISPVAASNFNTPTTVSFTGAAFTTPKEFTISCNVYKAGDRDIVTTKTFNVTVNPTPSIPTVVSATPASICFGYPSNINATSSGSTIEWFSVASGGTAIGTSASGVDFTINPTVTGDYYAGTLISATGCRGESRTPVAVTVVPSSAGGKLTGNANICSGVNNTLLTLSDYVGTIIKWETSTDNFTTASNIVNNTATLSASNVPVTTSYRAVVKSSFCASANSKEVVLSVSNPGKWLGVNTDWNNPLNWCNGIVPTAAENVIIENGLSNYPVIYGSVSVNNLTVLTGAVVALSSTGVLKVAGNINSKNGIKATSGTVELIGTGPQTIIGTNFISNTINNLAISNITAGASVSNPSVAILAIGGMLKVSGAVSFGNVNNVLLHTNDNLTLVSTAANTARVADVTNGDVNSNNTIAGKVVIERYISARRAWRFLTAPITGESNVTINESWQEGAVVTDPAANTSNTNPAPGYGTHVSFGYPLASPGYDLNINGNTSIKYYTSTGLNGIPPATNAGNIVNQPGYLLFVRGNRSIQLSMGTAAPLTATVLRVKGFINTGLTNVFLNPGFKIGSSNFRVLRNPYPSAIDFHKLMQNPANAEAGFSDAFYMWDVNLGGPNGIGGWVALSYNSLTGRYDRNIASNVDNSGAIQSGSAILIDYNGTAGNVVVREWDKLVNSNISMFRPVRSFNTIRTSLLGINADSSTEVIDAVLVSFNQNSSNEIDNRDMKKLDNSEECFSIKTNGDKLAIERRKPIVQADTIVYNITKMKQKNYQLLFEVDSIDLPKGTSIYLADLFLRTKLLININATITYNFNVNSDTLSSNQNRFRLIFMPPCDTAGSKKNVLNNAVITIFNADKLKALSAKSELSVIPNPVISNTIDLLMNELPAGNYFIILYNSAGKILVNKMINYVGGKNVQSLNSYQNLLNGTYQLQVIGPGKKSTTLKVIVQRK